MNKESTRKVSNAWRTHLLSSLAIFAALLDTTVLFVAFPSIRRTFSTVSTTELSWVLNAYNIVFSALLVPSGRLADQFGRRKLFLYGIGIFTVASALCGVAPGAGVLIGFRALQAAGAALVLPTSLALILAAFSQQKRAIAVTLWGAVAALAAAVGPSLGSAIVQSLGWRWAFYINVPVGLAILVLGSRQLEESRDPAAKQLPDFLGVALLILGVGALNLAIVASQAWTWSDVRTVSSLLFGFLAFLWFLRRAQRVPVPAVDLTLFSDPNYRYANLGTFFFGIAFNAMFLGNVLFLTQVWHYSTLLAGLAITPGPLAVIPTAVIAGRVATKFGHRSLIVAGGLIFATAGLLLYARAQDNPEYVAVWLPSALLIGIGVGLSLPTLSSAAVHGLTSNRFAVGSAVNQAVRQLGAVLGVALAFAFLGRFSQKATLSAFQRVFLLYSAGGVLTSIASLCIATRPAPGPSRTEDLGRAVAADAAEIAES